MAKKLINLAKINFAGNSGSAPGPTPAPSADADVVLRDYDGSVVASYTKEEFAALAELPTPPEHEGLTFQEWNWPLADAQAYCAQYGMVDIGATYITSDGKTSIYITLTEGRTSPTLGLGVNGSVDIDWGDGSTHDIITGSGVNTLINTQHNYSVPGDYIIVLTPEDNTSLFFLGSQSYGSYLLWASQNLSSSVNSAYQCAITKIKVGAGLTGFSTGALCKCFNLKEINIPRGVNSISAYAFSSCYSLEHINIPRSISTIARYLFNSCYGLKNVSIAVGVTYIDSNSFISCNSLSRITIPQSVTFIGDSAFKGCSGLRHAIIPQGINTIASQLFSGCSELKKLIIPSSVNTINSNAFSNCWALQDVIISGNLNVLGGSAFSGCFNLKNIRIPQGLSSLSNGTFQNCSSLREVNIPEGVTQIMSNNFNSCYGLTALDIPQSVTRIGSSAFTACYSMGIYRIHNTTPPTLESGAFTNVATDCIIYVPAESVEAYKAATNWSVYADKIQPMP